MTDLPHYANLRDGSMVELDRSPAAAVWVLGCAAITLTALLAFAAGKAIAQAAFDAAACPQMYLEGCSK